MRFYMKNREVMRFGNVTLYHDGARKTNFHIMPVQGKKKLSSGKKKVC